MCFLSLTQYVLHCAAINVTNTLATKRERCLIVWRQEFMSSLKRLQALTNACYFTSGGPSVVWGCRSSLKSFSSLLLLLCVILLLAQWPNLFPFIFLQHVSLGASRSDKATSQSSRSLGARCRNSIASCSDEQPHIGNYRLLKTIGKGNFAKVKLARHILTGREVSYKRNRHQRWEWVMDITVKNER